MTTVELGAVRGARRARVGRPFYLGMSIAMALVFIGGFSTTVPSDFAPKPGLPLLLHLHGAVFTLWVLLFVAQPAFISRGSLALHRKIGWAGLGLAGLMVVMGWIATVQSIQMHRVPKVFAPDFFLVMNAIGILVFAAIVAAGVALRRDAEWHKRVMLMATVSILGPGLGRLAPALGLGAKTPIVILAATLAFLLAGPVADLIVRRRVHPAYLWCIAVIVLFNAAIAPLAATPPVQAALRAIAS